MATATGQAMPSHANNSDLFALALRGVAGDVAVPPDSSELVT